MSAKLLKQIEKTHAALVKTGRADPMDFSSDFEEAKSQYEQALKDVDTKGLKPDSDEAIIFNAAIDLLDVLIPPEPSEQAEAAPAKDKAKAAPAKAAKGKNKTAGTTKAGTKVPRDVFGFGEGTKVAEFGKMLMNADGCTMKEVRSAKWNDKSLAYPNVFKGLVEKGLAEVRKDRMYASKKALKAA